MGRLSPLPIPKRIAKMQIHESESSVIHGGQLPDWLHGGADVKNSGCGYIPSVTDTDEYSLHLFPYHQRHTKIQVQHDIT